MLALYRAGRQADALVVYQEGRATLLDERGLDPSEALQQLEKAILRHDPALDLATPAISAPPVRSVEPGRKVVSVLFCEVVAYTELGDQADPEALGRVNARCFALASAVVEGYGGNSLERFVDDEVMAVFGVPSVREDDALRAVRAAVEIRDGLPGPRRAGADKCPQRRGACRQGGERASRRRPGGGRETAQSATSRSRSPVRPWRSSRSRLCL